MTETSYTSGNQEINDITFYYTPFNDGDLMECAAFDDAGEIIQIFDFTLNLDTSGIN